MTTAWLRTALPALALLGAIIVAPTAWLFSSLTVDVTDTEVIWRFGPGIWSHRVARNQIEEAHPIKTKWYWGYGIKYFGPNQWLYNVSGLDAVEIRLKGGGWRRIGTDDPISFPDIYGDVRHFYPRRGRKDPAMVFLCHSL